MSIRVFLHSLVFLLVDRRITRLSLVRSVQTSHLFSSSRDIRLMSTSNQPISYIGAETAKAIDDTLMSTQSPMSGGFSLDQLMELAGLSVASASHSFSQDLYSADIATGPAEGARKVCIICGPGNNGGDGLVAGRHLAHFGYNVTVLAPTIAKFPPTKAYFPHLLQQCQNLDVDILPAPNNTTTAEEYFNSFDMLIDAMFGFSFRGPARDPYASYITALTKTTKPVISIDIPSGWDVERGDVYSSGFLPEAVISLTLPKRCMLGYPGHHYVGGRYVVAMNKYCSGSVPYVHPTLDSCRSN
jgi:NAD(P)H-hydrate epimerase